MSQNSKDLTKLENPSNDEDWRSSKESIKDLIGHAFNSDLCSDVTFVVGAEFDEGPIRVPAHKVVLGLASEVFYSMFYGQLKEGNEVSVPDIEPRTFLALLRFIYTDMIDLSAGNVEAILYASMKYLVRRLSKVCSDFLSKELKPQNICKVLFTAKIFNLADLEDRCMEMLDDNANFVLESDGFLSFKPEFVKCILERQTLDCHELKAFTALEKWSEAECLRHGIEKASITVEDKKRVIGEMLYMIRFPIMSQEEFSNGPGQSELLTKSEKLDLLLRYAAKNKPAVQFKSLPRGCFVCANSGMELFPYEICWNDRDLHKQILNKSRISVLTPRTYSFDFKVDKKVCVAGYRLLLSEFGQSGNQQFPPTSLYPLRAQISEMIDSCGKVLAGTYYFPQNYCKTTECTFYEVKFKKTVRIYPGKIYNSSVMFSCYPPCMIRSSPEGRTTAQFGPKPISVTFDFYYKSIEHHSFPSIGIYFHPCQT